jgi:hypothetical protein
LWFLRTRPNKAVPLEHEIPTLSYEICVEVIFGWRIANLLPNFFTDRFVAAQ